MSLVKLDAEQYVVDVKTKKSGAANDDTFIIHLSVAAALLLYWATLSLMGEEARLAGVVAATVNLAVAGYLLSRLLTVAAGIRWGVLVVMGVDVIAAFIVAGYGFGTGRGKRYIKGKLPGKK